MKHRVWWCRNVDNQLSSEQNINLIVLVVLFESYFSHFSWSPWFTNQYFSRFMSLNCLPAHRSRGYRVNQPESYRKYVGWAPITISMCSWDWVVFLFLSSNSSNLKALKEPKGLQKVFMLFVGNFFLDLPFKEMLSFFQASNKLWIERPIFFVEDFGLQNDSVPKHRPKIQPLDFIWWFHFPILFSRRIGKATTLTIPHGRSHDVGFKPIIVDTRLTGEK